MAGTLVTIKLTPEQQQQIKEATGQKVTALYMELVPNRSLTDKELDKVAGGFQWNVKMAP